MALPQRRLAGLSHPAARHPARLGEGHIGPELAFYGFA